MSDADGDVAGLPVEYALPVRRFYAWRGKRNYEGSWWSSTVRAHVGFESLLEREYLVAADHDPDVVAVSSQPFALLWPRCRQGPRFHVPDFFVRLSSGDGRVVDVRPERRTGTAAQQFKMTAGLCARVGWQYEVFTGLPEPRRSNLRWVAGYRQDRFEPPSDAAATLRDVFCPATSIEAGVRRAARCLRCTGGTLIYGRLPHMGHVCLKHKRWITHQQHDVRRHPQLLSAEHYFRRTLAPRGVLPDSPMFDLAHEALYSSARLTEVPRRAEAMGPCPRLLLLYPETVRIVGLLARPSVMERLTSPEPRPAIVDREDILCGEVRRLLPRWPSPDGVANRLWYDLKRILAQRRIARRRPVTYQSFHAELLCLWARYAGSAAVQ